MKKKINIIVATTSTGGIGYNNTIPWYIKEELTKFKNITSITIDKTKKNAIIMGYNTWDSLPKKPLKNRLNIILTKKNIEDTNIKTFDNINIAINYCFNNDEIENIFVIGGEMIYNKCLEVSYIMKYLPTIYLSIIEQKNINCNKFINIDNIYNYFYLIEDDFYKNEKELSLFSSYICIPKEYNYELPL